MSEEKVKFVRKRIDPEKERINKEILRILRASGSEILRIFFGQPKNSKK